MFQADKKPILFNKELTGNPITFNSRLKNMPLSKCEITIPVTQQGSGTPSLDNIRDFISFSGVNIGQTSGYGEYFRGLLNGTYGFVDLGDLSYTMSASGQLRASGRPNVKSVTGGQTNTIISNSYTRWNGTQPDEFNALDKVFSVGNYNLAVNKIIIRDSDIASASDAPSALSGVYLIYELETPSTPVTPQQFATLCQAFGITGNTYSISFGQTVYSANLDVLTGKLSITHGIIDLGDLEWNLASAATRFYTNDITDISLEADFTNMFCSGYNVISSAVSFSNMPDKSIKRGQSNATISVRDLDYPDKDLFTASVTGMKLVYELAEPIEIQLTPTQITTLIGENVIFADVADVTECKYTRK